VYWAIYSLEIRSHVWAVATIDRSGCSCSVSKASQAHARGSSNHESESTQPWRTRSSTYEESICYLIMQAATNFLLIAQLKLNSKWQLALLLETEAISVTLKSMHLRFT
jgi:hypothetical protein